MNDVEKYIEYHRVGKVLRRMGDLKEAGKMFKKGLDCIEDPEKQAKKI